MIELSQREISVLFQDTYIRLCTEDLRESWLCRRNFPRCDSLLTLGFGFPLLKLVIWVSSALPFTGEFPLPLVPCRVRRAKGHAGDIPSLHVARSEWSAPIPARLERPLAVTSGTYPCVKPPDR